MGTVPIIGAYHSNSLRVVTAKKKLYNV